MITVLLYDIIYMLVPCRSMCTWPDANNYPMCTRHVVWAASLLVRCTTWASARTQPATELRPLTVMARTHARRLCSLLYSAVPVNHRQPCMPWVCHGCWVTSPAHAWLSAGCQVWPRPYPPPPNDSCPITLGSILYTGMAVYVIIYTV